MVTSSAEHCAGNRGGALLFEVEQIEAAQRCHGDRLARLATAGRFCQNIGVLHDHTHWCLKPTPPFGVVPTFKIDDDQLDGFGKIRCPKCQWAPEPSSRWMCAGSAESPEPPFRGCGMSWNTFETRGRCPSCAHQWRWTACLRCGTWSRHDDWYDASRRIS
jgi:hypothetical protein